MSRLVEQRINTLACNGSDGVLSHGRKGIEKESLRVLPDGQLAHTPHPELLGSALTNPFITTDFSEALLEFVSPAYESTWETMRFLCEIHQFTYDRIGEELLWVTSMPCLIGHDEDIPLAQYGNSNVGRMKTVYRNGLGYRYGRKMQAIAGVHFNYSLPEMFWDQYHKFECSSLEMDKFRAQQYMGMVRNFRRFGWMVLYLFGASPAVCKSFMDGQHSDMKNFNETTYYEPYATSLRMSDLGYSNNTQAHLRMSVNSLDDYINDLNSAICTREPKYEEIGVKVDGIYRQLSASQLQIENEFYSPIRPKRVAHSGERPTAALRRGGVEYVEVRSLDINILDPVGINQNTMRFMEAFLIYCLLEASPPFNAEDWVGITSNHDQVAKSGRDPELRLFRDGAEVGLKEWGREILENVRAIAEIIDRGEGRDDYSQAVDAQEVLIDDPNATPSARILEEMRQEGLGFFNLAMNAALTHREYFTDLVDIEEGRLRMYSDEAARSIRRQAEIEESDQLSFDEYLERYFSEQGCCD